MDIDPIAAGSSDLRGTRVAPPPVAVSWDSSPRSEHVSTPGNAMDRRELETRVEKANSEMSSMNQDLRFSVHEKSGEMFVQVVDSRSGKVLRQSPPKEFLDLSVRLHEMVGLFLDAKK